MGAGSGNAPNPKDVLAIEANPKTFLPNPALVGQTVKAKFGLMIDDPVFNQEAQTKGIDSEEFKIRMEGGGGKITSVMLAGFTPNPTNKSEGKFDETFKGLLAGQTRSDPQHHLTLTVNLGGDELTITGTKGSPLIMQVEVQGTFSTPGECIASVESGLFPVRGLAQP